MRLIERLSDRRFARLDTNHLNRYLPWPTAQRMTATAFRFGLAIGQERRRRFGDLFRTMPEEYRIEAWRRFAR